MTPLLNGCPCDQLSVQDRSTQYGDGLFETVAIFSGKVRHRDRHLQRMRHGASILKLPQDQVDCLFAEIDRWASSHDKVVVKAMLTRGNSQGGYALLAEPDCHRIIIPRPMPAYVTSWQTDGIHLTQCEHTLTASALLGGIKHNNRLDQVLARAEWHDSHWHEGVTCDAQGRVIECVSSNLFWIKDDNLYTPPIEQSGVKGTMRSLVFDWAKRNNIALYKSWIEAEALTKADALFITNAVIGVVPVNVYLQTQFQHHPLVRRLQADLCSES